MPPTGNLNTEPDLKPLATDGDKDRWRWRPLGETASLKREQRLAEVHRPIIEEVVRKDWNGVLKLMINDLGAQGVGTGVVIAAAIKTNRYNLAIKLLKRVHNARTLHNPERTLLHTLAMESNTGGNTGLQSQVVKLMTTLDPKLIHTVDTKFFSNAIVYAAANWNCQLMREYSEALGGVGKVAALAADALLRTPVSALFWSLHTRTDQTLPKDVTEWLLKLLAADPELVNAVAYYPFTESPYPGVRLAATSDTKASAPGAVKYTPLIVAVICGHYLIVKDLLNLKASDEFVVDVNRPDSSGRTPLMHAVRLNDIKMVKLLLNRDYKPEKDRRVWAVRPAQPQLDNKTCVDTKTRDTNGWTVYHHMATPLVNYTYANSDAVLAHLWPSRAILTLTNNEGRTANQLACDRIARNLEVKFQELMLFNWKAPVFPSLSLTVDVLDRMLNAFLNIKIDYKSDAKKMCEQLDAEVMDTDNDKEPDFVPDSLIGIDAAQRAGKLLGCVRKVNATGYQKLLVARESPGMRARLPAGVSP
ncbi:unnamed protein product [Medioppia subpectinata]|uniref:Uncharacterized protein n=1 Tax=Medioppia subpectinata TaxID=1979941 RepID=A0A7R9PU78_9ACAR|nr:unnamed protein product [Medioppia subpectinata]CAG2101284.1 unnamed protein product [Medioppia subpectinata]